MSKIYNFHKISFSWDTVFFVIFIYSLLRAVFSLGKNQPTFFFLLQTIVGRNCNLSIKSSLKWMDTGIDKSFPNFFWYLTSIVEIAKIIL